MERNLVSVVMPAYNRARTIERAVDSILAQDYPSIEVIVVDDGSKDDTAEVMRSRYGSDPRVVFIQQPNGGVCVARNTGIARARGEFIAMLDSDDAWLPGKLSLQVGILRKHPELSLVCSDMDAVDTEGKVAWPRYMRKYFGTFRFYPRLEDLFASRHETESGVAYYMGDISRSMILGNLILTSTVVARADRIAAAGRYDQGFHPCEDQDYYFRLSKTGPFALVDRATILYTTGADDQESGPKKSVALSRQYLAVISKRLREEKELAARLPRGLVEQALADGYAWAGYAHFDKGLMPEARRYYVKRLMSRPADRAAWKYHAATLLPDPLLRKQRAAS
jgi:glycosyltransferase involved in cell wall biosynthesis